MEATRVRFGSVLEWVIAAGCILLAVAIGSIALREFRHRSAGHACHRRRRPHSGTARWRATARRVGARCFC